MTISGLIIEKGFYITECYVLKWEGFDNSATFNFLKYKGKRPEKSSKIWRAYFKGAYIRNFTLYERELYTTNHIQLTTNKMGFLTVIMMQCGLQLRVTIFFR